MEPVRIETHKDGTKSLAISAPPCIKNVEIIVPWMRDDLTIVSFVLTEEAAERLRLMKQCTADANPLAKVFYRFLSRASEDCRVIIGYHLEFGHVPVDAVQSHLHVHPEHIAGFTHANATLTSSLVLANVAELFERSMGRHRSGQCALSFLGINQAQSNTRCVLLSMTAELIQIS